MDTMLTRNWGWLALRGLAALTFGILTLMNPAISLAVLVFLFGAYAFVDGIFLGVAAVANRRGESQWVALLLAGIAGVIIGAITFFWPQITATALLWFIAAWALVMGIGELVGAVRLRKVISGEWMLGLAGLVSIAFGVLLIARPMIGALAVAIWIGAFAIVFGILQIGLAFRLRAWGGHRHPPATPVPGRA